MDLFYYLKEEWGKEMSSFMDTVKGTQQECAGQELGFKRTEGSLNI